MSTPHEQDRPETQADPQTHLDTDPVNSEDEGLDEGLDEGEDEGDA